MAGFLYFRAGDTRPITRDLIAKYGLGYAFTGGLTNRPTSSTSPSGTPGLVFADASRQEGQDVGYHPDRQTWRKLPRVEGRPELWVGYWNEAKPGPSDLERTPMLRGPKVRLADGNSWQIPIVRRFDDIEQQWRCELPAYLDVDDSGRVVRGTPRGEYAKLWEITTPLADSRIDGGTITDDELFAAIEALLQANYVVGLSELTAIHALSDDETLAIICTVATRYDTFVSWLESAKKKNVEQTPNGEIMSVGAVA